MRAFVGRMVVTWIHHAKGQVNWQTHSSASLWTMCGDGPKSTTMATDVGLIPDGTTLVDGAGDPCYEVLRLLGEGGYARAYLCQVRDPDKAGQAYVLKVPNDPRRVIQFAREAWWGRVCRMPGIVVCCWCDHTEVAGRRLPVFVMPFMMRGSMANRIHNRDYTVRQALGWVRRVAEVMSRFPGVHRDLKPDNLLYIDEDPLVSDFGLALPLDPNEVKAWGDRYSPAGTLRYMAPEQALGQAVDRRSDIYSIGFILNELFASDIDLGGDDKDLITLKVSSEISFRPTGHESIDKIVHRCTRRKAEARYQHYGELIEALDTAAKRY